MDEKSKLISELKNMFSITLDRKGISKIGIYIIIFTFIPIYYIIFPYIQIVLAATTTVSSCTVDSNCASNNCAADIYGSKWCAPSGTCIYNNTATTTVLSPTADAQVLEYYPTTNYGSSTQVAISPDGWANWRGRSYFRFDLSSIRSTSTVSSATFGLRLQSTFNGEVHDALVNLNSQHNTAWSESTITWNTAPAFGSTESTITVYSVVGDWYTWSPSVSRIENNLSSTISYTLAFQNEDSDYCGSPSGHCDKSFDSREVTATPPNLTVNYQYYFNTAETQGVYTCNSDTWELNNGQSCTSDSECYYDNCKSDYSGGSYCCNSGQCAHSGTCYNSGTILDGHMCSSGTWSTSAPTWVEGSNTTKIASPAVYSSNSIYGFQINWTDNVEGNFDNATFELCSPTGLCSNYTNASSSTPQTMNRSYSGNQSIWYINFTQGQLGNIGTYNFTWYGIDTTGLQNKTSRVDYLVIMAGNLSVLCDVGGPYISGSTVLVSGNVTFSNGTQAVSDLTLGLSGGTSIIPKTTTSDSDGKYYFIVSNTLAVATYTANVSGNVIYSGYNISGWDTCNFEVKSQAATAAACQNKNISISGRAVYSDTGQPIPSGIVRASILDTSYTNQTSFTNGQYEITVKGCLILGKRYTVQTLIDNNEGKRYWAYSIFVVT